MTELAYTSSKSQAHRVPDWKDQATMDAGGSDNLILDVVGLLGLCEESTVPRERVGEVGGFRPYFRVAVE